MTATVLLVRHATCAQTGSVLLGRTLDSALDAAGEAQADTLAQYLQAKRNLLLYASPRRRTRQTAHAISQSTGVPIVITHQLDEIDFGSWSGQAFDALAQDRRWQHWNLHRASASTPAADTMQAAQRRVLDFIGEQLRVHPGQTLALVTHAEIIRAALLHYLHLGLDDYARIQVDPASMSSVEFSQRHPVAVQLNQYAPAWKHCA